VLPEYVLRTLRVKPGWLVLVAVEVGLIAEQPLVAHSRKRRLARDAADEGDQGRDKRPSENRVIEDSPAGAVRKREAFNVRCHDSSSSTFNERAREKLRVILRFLRNALRRAQKTATYGKAR
jgi:hypothetical protein